MANISQLHYASVTISNGGTVSTAAEVKAGGGQTVVGVVIPAAFTGTSITFQTSHDNSTFNTLYDKTNTAYTVTVTQGRNYIIPPADLAGWSYVKVVSGSAEGAGRTVVLVVRQV